MRGGWRPLIQRFQRRFQSSLHAKKHPPRTRLIMDDGPPLGPGTADPSSASKRDLALQSPGAASLLLGRPDLQSKRNVPLKMFPILNHGCHLFLPAASLTSPRCCQGWVERPERRVHILFIWPDHFTSAFPFPPLHALYSGFVDALPCWNKPLPG